MNSPRRAFLRTGALAFFGGIAWPGLSKGASAGRLAFSAEEQVVADWLAGFSGRVRLVGGAVFEKLHGRNSTRVLWRAEIADFARMAGGLSAAAGATGVYSAGDTVFFRTGDCEMSLENVMAATFRQRESARAEGRATFAHEALAYDPASGELSDPTDAASAAELRLINRGKSLAEAFDTVLRGLIEARRLGLTPDAAFQRFRARVLAAKVTRVAVAKPIARALLGKFATLSEIVSGDELAGVLASPLVATSLQVALGTDVQRTIRRAQAGGGTPAAWLEGLMGRVGLHETGRDTTRAWLASGDYFDQLRSRSALLEAQTLAG